MRANEFSGTPRVLILVPTLKDAEMTVQILSASSMEVVVCTDLHHLSQEIDLGADAAIIAEQYIIADNSGVLEKELRQQPPWSDFPLIVLTSAERNLSSRPGLPDSAHNMTLLAKPLQITTMLSTLRSALRDRKRQYRIRDYLLAAETNQRELRISEQRFRDMADSINQMVWVARPDGYTEYYNKRWYDYTGVPTGSTDGEGWNGMFHPEDQDRARRRWQRSLNSGRPYEIEYRLRRADGVYRWALGRAECVRHDDGTIRKWYGTCTDIQELVDTREHAQAANIAKTDFLANMSHEIRTPMNAIIGLTHILQTEELSSKQQELISVLGTSANSLLTLINDLLDISKIEAGAIELESVPFSFADILEQVRLMVSGKAKDKGIKLVIDDAGVRDIRFRGDPTRLQQILVNLANNAIKFTEQGRVEISIERQASSAGRESVSMRVKDTGIGIEQKNLERIFGKFTQADSSTNREYGGTGLGLSICKALVEAMGGSITLSSQPAKGSVFSVEVPLSEYVETAEVPAEQEHPPNEIEAGEPAQKVLLVEDNRANVLVASLLLKRFGYQCDVATDGQEAIRKVALANYLAVLMDVQMPGTDGIEATQAIRKREREAGTAPSYIIGMTAHALTGDREKCLDAGMDDYLPKPFDPERLRRLLGNRAATLP